MQAGDSVPTSKTGVVLAARVEGDMFDMNGVGKEWFGEIAGRAVNVQKDIEEWGADSLATMRMRRWMLDNMYPVQAEMGHQVVNCGERR